MTPFWTKIPFRYNLGVKGDTKSGLNVNLKITEMKGRFQTEFKIKTLWLKLSVRERPHCPELAYITF